MFLLSGRTHLLVQWFLLFTRSTIDNANVQVQEKLQVQQKTASANLQFGKPENKQYDTKPAVEWDWDLLFKTLLF